MLCLGLAEAQLLGPLPKSPPSPRTRPPRMLQRAIQRSVSEDCLEPCTPTSRMFYMLTLLAQHVECHRIGVCSSHQLLRVPLLRGTVGESVLTLLARRR